MDTLASDRSPRKVAAPLMQKLIHQIWIGATPIPERLTTWMSSWSEHFPGWDYRLWTDREVLDFLPCMVCRDVFVSQPNIGLKSDILRLELLREFGGMYADCDFECLRPFEHLLQEDCFHYGDEYPGRPGNAWMFSPTNHPIPRLLLEQFSHSLSCPIGMDGNWHSVVNRTGPEALQRALNFWVGHWVGEVLYDGGAGVGVIYPGRVVALWREVTYPYSYIDHDSRDFSAVRYPRAFMAHHWSGTWK